MTRYGNCNHCGNPDCFGLCDRANENFRKGLGRRKPDPTLWTRINATADAWLSSHPLLEMGVALACISAMGALVFQGCQLLLGAPL